MPRRRIPPGGHTLPPLPYPYEALEPFIIRNIMFLHHRVHHQSYVDGLNQAELALVQARQTGNYNLVRHWERELAFHGSGHFLHAIFWLNMTPHYQPPFGEILQQIELDFGSYQKFKEHFSEAAVAVEGPGWALLVFQPQTGKLEILAAENHQHWTQWGVIPLLVLDVWEHAYYLQYQANRREYINNWWQVVNWKDAEERFLKVRQLVLPPFYTWSSTASPSART